MIAALMLLLTPRSVEIWVVVCDLLCARVVVCCDTTSCRFVRWRRITDHIHNIHIHIQLRIVANRHLWQLLARGQMERYGVSILTFAVRLFVFVIFFVPSWDCFVFVSYHFSNFKWFLYFLFVLYISMAAVISFRIKVRSSNTLLRALLLSQCGSKQQR